MVTLKLRNSEMAVIYAYLCRRRHDILNQLEYLERVMDRTLAQDIFNETRDEFFNDVDLSASGYSFKVKSPNRLKEVAVNEDMLEHLLHYYTGGVLSLNADMPSDNLKRAEYFTTLLTKARKARDIEHAERIQKLWDILEGTYWEPHVKTFTYETKCEIIGLVDKGCGFETAIDFYAVKPGNHEREGTCY